MKTVYFVRHGEAENNTRSGNIYHGFQAELTSRGRQQAALIAERASKLEFDALISSPWPRTRATAEAIAAKTGHRIEFNESFMERRCPSSFIGRPWDDVETQRMQGEWLAVFYADDGSRYLDGENFDDMKKRAADSWQHLSARSEERIMVVTHGLFLRTLLAYAIFGERLTGAMHREFEGALRTSNTGITIFERHPDAEYANEERWRMRVWNDHVHLA